MTSLKTLKNIDIRTVDIASLVDAETVSVDMDLPVQERIADTIRQMNGNPYFFRSGGIAVEISFADTHITLNDCTENWLRMQ